MGKLVAAGDGYRSRMAKLLAVVVTVCLGLAACSSSAKQSVNKAGARAAAETARGVLKSKDLKNGESVRSVSVLQDAADKVPGSPDVTGISDGNGDGIHVVTDDTGSGPFLIGGTIRGNNTTRNARYGIELPAPGPSITFTDGGGNTAFRNSLGQCLNIACRTR